MTVRLTCKRFKPPGRRRPPGQSKILVVVQGFSELSGGGDQLPGQEDDDGYLSRHPIRIGDRRQHQTLVL
jgi:hypothetical protein